MSPTEKVTFPNRRARAEFIARKLRTYIHGKVLDVGCDEAHLKDILTLTEYTGVDIAGKPDLQLNLEKIDRLPFGDRAFDTVLCCEVLEHLDNLHFISGELARVAAKHLIISLPNNWCNARRPVARGRGHIGHYGLPLTAPMDRHKWFFSLGEAKEFLHAKAAEQGFRVMDDFATEKPRPLPVSVWRHLRHPDNEQYLNRFAHTYWIVLERVTA